MLRRKSDTVSAVAAVRAALDARQAAEAAVEAAEAAEAAAAAQEDGDTGDIPAVRHDPRRPRPGARRWNTLAAALFAVVLVGLLVTAGALARAHQDSQDARDQDLAMLGAARQSVLNLISPSSQDPAAGADRIINDATGSWLTEFEGTKDQFVSAIAESKTESSGEILGAGIEGRSDDGSTTVLVSAVSKVSNAAGAKDEPRTWRLRVGIVDVDGSYKLSKVEVVP
ncbi:MULTISPECIES: hypothetical protein [Rhodococcus]|uniref:Mce-associated membrane protein n=1 Tax=Rhodococcus oxybenzonivorans TaxID=1990687 RepID=A0AAE4UWW2_9NOCA|nr:MULTISPECIES: hypothetical protein [Rhodococcus]MDV7241566.1 hypothetical protein [Rhodococcus oxybenzonivorans]MDV7264151.1 hypothetical protein [Rhodococcus oxybenzonivorans]MDV7273901.1 hypothetical protein [Rhodococcus oxybenzonivorans]MDV7333847.1 hypothetical protein [Rhodococcus oxybenzonivorans]MDV7343266.1 hypothetical protein [Rhodococcus oxybenzonivorans]